MNGKKEDDITSYWRIPFGIVSAAVGMFFFYAGWADHPFNQAVTPCAVSGTNLPRFTNGWKLDYINTCGGLYDYSYLFLIGFTLVSFTLLTGGILTLRHEFIN